MSEWVGKPVYKPELLQFEMHHYGNKYVCWFAGPYFTCKIKFVYPTIMDLMYDRNVRLLFRQKLSLTVSTFYRTRNFRYVKKSENRADILNSYLGHWILGSVAGFIKALRARGVGYKFNLYPSKITIHAGYSHILTQNLPKLGYFQWLMLNKKSSLLLVKSSNYSALKRFLARMRNFRKPDNYKGKGLRFKKELIRRKEGKKKKTT